MLLVFIALLSVQFSYAQPQADVVVYGNVKDHFTRKKLAGVVVKVKEGGQVYDSQTITSSGKYEFFLPLNRVYTVHFEKQGYVSKFFEVDARNIAEEDVRGGFSMPADVSLFEVMENVDFSILDQPIGRSTFEPERGSIEWDMEYTNRMLNEVSRLMREVEKAKEDADKEEDAAADAAAKLEEDFKKFMSNGESDMKKSAYDGAIKNFQGALELKPDDPVAKAKLEEAQKKYDEQQAALEADKKYNDFIDAADNAFRSKNWDDAVANYTSASEVKPSEKYPKDQLKLAQEELEKLKDAAEKEAAVAKLILEGDEKIGAQSFKGGIDKYKQALSLIPQHKEASEKLTAAEQALADYEAEAEQRAAYEGFISEGDHLFSSKDYQASITKYESASAVFPKEAYPKDRIQEARDLIAQIEADEAAAAELAEKQARFDGLMADGDEAMSSSDYDTAISKYTEALDVLPDEPMATKKLAEAEKAKTDAENAAEAEEIYRKAIAEADRYFGQEEFEAAIEKYREALEAKEDEYPKSKIAEAEQAIKDKLAAEEEAARLEAEQAELAAKKEQYEAFMKNAEKAMKETEYDVAIQDYTSALGVFPEDSPALAGKEAAEKAKADALAAYEEEQRLKAEAAALADKQEAYDEFMSEGHEAVKDETYEPAIAAFKNALVVFPDDKNATADLAAAEKALEDQRAQMAEAERKAAEAAALAADEAAAAEALAAKQAEFESLMDKGERALKNNGFQEAIEAFGNASSIFPDDTKAPERRSYAEAEWTKWKAEQGAAEQQAAYDAFMDDARREMKDKSYADAIENYKGALGVFENDSDALSGLETARKALADQEADAEAEAKRLAEEAERAAALASAEETQRRFDDLMQNGDNAMTAETYQAAIDSYSEALQVFPDNDKAKKKLERAERALQDQLALADAEAKRRAEEEARQAELDAQRALENAEEAERRRLQEEEQAYLDAIKEADSYFNYKDYLVSKTYYEDALAIRPDEVYPQSRIEKIEMLLKQAEEDERLRAERELREQELAESRGYTRGQDLENSAEDDLDARMAEERRKALEAKWEAMRQDKESWREAEDRMKRGAGSRVEENSNLVKSFQTTASDMEARSKEELSERSDNMSSYKEALAGQDQQRIDSHDKAREEAGEVIQGYKDQSAQEQERFYGKSSTYTDHQKELLALKESKEDIQSRGQEDYEQKLDKQERTTTSYATFNKKKREESDDKLDEAHENIESAKASLAEQNAKSAEMRNEEQIAILDLEKDRQKGLYERLSSESSEKRTENLETVYKERSYRSPKEYMEFDANSLVQDYPQGVTEETIEENNKSTIRRIVVVGNKAYEYRKVLSRSGTYYFKDGISISKYIWDLESDKVPE